MRKTKTKRLLAMLLMLAMAVGLLAAMPLTAGAQDSGATPASAAGHAAFAAVTKDNWKDYDTPLPTGGSAVTEAELQALKEAIWNSREPGDYTYNPDANGYNYAYLTIENYSGNVNVIKQETWSIRNPQYSYLTKNLYLAGSYADKTFMYLRMEDDAYSYNYNWVAGSNRGYLNKWAKTPYDPEDPGEEWIPPVQSEYVVYADETVLGEVCFVYSYRATYSDGRSFVNYEWISRSSGYYLKFAETDATYTYTSIRFYDDNVVISPSFFTDAAAGVAFTEEWYEWRNDAGTAPPAAPEVPVDTAAITAFVTRLYSLVLDREPDSAGIEAWVDRLVKKEYTGGGVAKTFFFDEVHKEFVSRGLSNEEFLTIMYKTFMNRDPDEVGWPAWLDRMANQGYTWQKVFDGFVESAEWIDICKAAGINP